MGRKSRKKRERKHDTGPLYRSSDSFVPNNAIVEQPNRQAIHQLILVSLLLILATFVAYWQVWNHDFVYYDDNVYVTENKHVQAGLTTEGIVWSLTAIYASNWHPLTWLSHMLDCQLFGMDAGWHHLTNLLFHISNALLLFIILKRMTGNLWPSGFVAAAFALHPLHVESVAWIAERKDVLSTFFWMLTLYFYFSWTKRKRNFKYLVALCVFILGLMAKPMLVTLPFVLILLDYWPLRRIHTHIEKSDHNNSHRRKVSFHFVLEKIPFFFVVAIACALTLFAQEKGGAVVSLDVYSIGVRIANALVSYLEYIGKMFWPIKLAVIYPHPGVPPLWKIVFAILFLTSASVFAIKSRRKRPYLTVGWFWYLGTLIPVIGLVQVGSQAFADRYTYIPLIGLFIVIAWGIADITANWRQRQIILATLAGALFLILTVLSSLQVDRWRNSVTLFKHTLDVTVDNWLAHNNLGLALADQGQIKEAMDHYQEALRLRPNYQDAHNNLGVALADQGRIREAIDHFQEALRLRPNDEDAHNNIGVALANQGRTKEAIDHFQEALLLRPNDEHTHNNLGLALADQGQVIEAIVHYQEALRLRPNYQDAHNNLGVALADQGRIREAIDHFQEALRIEPKNPEPYCNLGAIYRSQGKYEKAAEYYQKALSLQPKYALVLQNLALVYAMQGEYDKALSFHKKTIKLQPDNAGAYYNVACMYAQMGQLEKAIDWLKKAIERGFERWDLIKTDQDLENIRNTSYYKQLVKAIAP